MAWVERRRLGDVGPFGEALAPPFIVLRDRMELWKVEGKRTNAWCHRPLHRPRLGLHKGEAHADKSEPAEATLTETRPEMIPSAGVAIVVALPYTTSALNDFALRLVESTPGELYEVIFVDTGVPVDVRSAAEQFG